MPNLPGTKKGASHARNGGTAQRADARKKPGSGPHLQLPHPSTIKLGHKHREHIQAVMILKRLQGFVFSDFARPRPDNVNMTRTQVHAALALLRKVLPDLASVEVSGNPEKPLMVQVVRFSDDGEQLSEPRPVLDMGKLIEMDRTETLAIEAESTGRRKNGRGD